MIWNSGFIYSRDLVLPTDLSLTYGDLTDTWDNIHSHRNLELNKIPLFILLSTADNLIGTENTLKLLLGIVVFSVLFVTFISLLFVFKGRVKSNIKLIAICAPPSLLYLFNPWVVDRISNHLFMVLGMALTPLIVIMYINLLNRGWSYPKIFSASLLLAGLSAVSTHNIFYVIPILLVITTYYIVVTPLRRRILLSSLLFFAFYICISSYWIVPLVYESAAAPIQPSYNFSISEIERLSQRNTLPNVVQMVGGGAWKSPLMYQNENSYYLGFIIPVVSVFAIALFLSNKFVILLGVLLICFLVLALGTNSPLPNWIFSSALAGVMWLYRDPSRFIQFIVLIYSILLAFTIYRIVSTRRLSRMATVFVICFILVNIIASFSTYTFVNSAGGRFIPSVLPTSITDVRSFLGNDSGNYKVLWLPLRSYLNYDWNKANGDVAGNIYLQSSPKETYDVSSTQSNRAINFLRYLYSNMFLNQTTNQMGQILKIYGIKYVIVFSDLVGSQKVEADKIVNIMNAQRDMHLINQFGPYSVYINTVLDSENTKFYASTMSVAVANLSSHDPKYNLDLWRAQPGDPNQSLKIIDQSPTHYRLNITATRPFLLIFAETYDPLWKMDIDGKEFVSPVQAYYFLNGFHIDEPGQHIIELEYSPQIWFNVGVVLTVITLLVFLSYCIISIRKGRFLQVFDVENNSMILSESFEYWHMLQKLKSFKKHFSEKGLKRTHL